MISGIIFSDERTIFCSEESITFPEFRDDSKFSTPVINE
jgi:hypothetical protein